MITTKSLRMHLLGAAACGTVLLFSTGAAAQLPVVGGTGAKNCHVVGKVKGASGFGKHADWERVAKYKALKHAEEMNAHHVVWSNVRSTGAFNGEVTALAFACD